MLPFTRRGVNSELGSLHTDPLSTHIKHEAVRSQKKDCGLAGYVYAMIIRVIIVQIHEFTKFVVTHAVQLKKITCLTK